MLKTALFILFVGGFQFNGVDKFSYEKSESITNMIPCNTSIQSTPAIYKQEVQSNYWMPKTYKADVLFIQSKKELIRLIKENKDRELLIYSLKQGRTVSFTIEPITRKWKEEIEKEEVTDYEVELK